MEVLGLVIGWVAAYPHLCVSKHRGEWVRMSQRWGKGYIFRVRVVALAALSALCCSMV
jgi:hypothetical protein